MIYNSIYELIGRTPIVKLSKIEKEAADIYVKIESFNPGGSIKDRAALYMIEEAERSGVLTKGQTIIEATSGNTGISLAMIGASKGYNVIIVMPDSMSIERRTLMTAYGAELILTPGANGMNASVEKAKELVKKKGYFMPDQFNNYANVAAHIETTAREILEEFGNNLDAFIAAVGSGGTISGVGSILKKSNPNISIVAVQPAKSPVLTGGKPSSHGIQGIGANFIPDILDKDVFERVIDIDEERAYEASRYLAEREGILAGISSGANLAAAMEVARNLGSGRKVLTVLPDTGERYLSTNLFRKE